MATRSKPEPRPVAPATPPETLDSLNPPADSAALATRETSGALATPGAPWWSRVADALATGDSRALSAIPGLKLEVFGGEKLWAKLRPQTIIVGNLLGYEDRPEKDDKGAVKINQVTGEVITRRDYLVELTGLPTDVLVRGSDDPDVPESEIVLVPSRLPGVMLKTRRAEVGEVVHVSEIHQLKKIGGRLEDLIGTEIALVVDKQVPIKGGRSVWRASIFSNEKPASTSLVAESAEPKALGTGASATA